MELGRSLRMLASVAFFRALSGDPAAVERHWENYWRRIQKTGRDGEVLWDTEPERASEEDIARFRPHVDPTLPLVDLGCGNGRQTRSLGTHFDRVIGVDVSPTAISKARDETPLDQSIRYRVLDARKPYQARKLHREIGDVNVYIRSVMHVIAPKDRPSFVDSLSTLIGRRGTLYQIELSSRAIDYFRTLPGDSPSGLPRTVHNIIRTGATTFGFDPAERFELYPDDRFEVVAAGDDVTIKTVMLNHGAEGRIPASYLVVRNR